MFEPDIERLLKELETLGDENDRKVSDRRYKLLNLERPTAELVSLLIRCSGRKRVLEIGTSNGYSTIWIAASLRGIHGSHLTTIERFPEKIAQAHSNLKRTGLHGDVTMLEGDATEVVRDLSSNFDCVFFDADRVSAPAQLEILLPKLNKDVLLLADNVLSHAEEIAGYRAMVERLPGFAWTLTPVGKGLHIAWRGAS